MRAAQSKSQRDMLGSRVVNHLRLHFGNRQSPDRPLVTGVHRVVREANGLVSVADGAQGALMAQFCVDRRGLWLQVASGMPGMTRLKPICALSRLPHLTELSLK